MSLQVLIVGDLSTVSRDDLAGQHGCIVVGLPDAVADLGALLYSEVEIRQQREEARKPKPPPPPPPWLPWSPTGEIRFDGHAQPLGKQVHYLVSADLFERRDGQWTWAAEVVSYVPDPTWTGEGDPRWIRGRGRKGDGTAATDATAREQAEAWIAMMVAKVSA